MSWRLKNAVTGLPRLTLFGRSVLLLAAELLANAVCWIVCGILFGRRAETRSILSLALLAWVSALCNCQHVQRVNDELLLLRLLYAHCARSRLLGFDMVRAFSGQCAGIVGDASKARLVVKISRLKAVSLHFRTCRIHSAGRPLGCRVHNVDEASCRIVNGASAGSVSAVDSLYGDGGP